MLTELATLAWRIDQWMKAKVGRLYTIVLAVALVEGILANAHDVENALGHPGNLIQIAVTVGFDLILLVNQIAQLHEYRESVRARRAARKASG